MRCTTSTATITPPRRCGRPAATHWSDWYPLIREDCLSRRRPDAPGSTRIAALRTAMACISVQIPNNTCRSCKMKGQACGLVFSPVC